MRVQLYRSVSRLLVCVLCAASMYVTADAQTPGQNINMVSGTTWPGGDPFLQRQNEPSIAVSTRNPLHLLAGANDYRTVDLPLTDVIPGAPMWGDAWLGLFKSFDGGQTWQSTLLPGYPQDMSLEGAASPLKGLTAGSDPVVRTGTNGLFYYSGIAFNRGTDQGVVFVARFIDLNNKENGDATQNADPIRYLGTVAVDRGNAGQFLDKPWIAVDIPRGGGSCMIQVPEPGAPGGTVTQTIPAGNVYLVYSIFVGNEINIRTKLYLSRSTDCGATWSKPTKLSEGLPINQGSIVQVDPVTGYVYVVWRAFATVNTPDAIYIAKSIDGGQTFTKAIQVVALPSFDPKNPSAASFFDQGTTATSFRTQDFPAMAIDGNGRIYVAWSQRGVGPNGEARIMMKTSLDGYNWSSAFPVDNGAISDDYGLSFTRGHQIMPQMTFTGGKLMVIYYDLRLDHTVGIFTPNDPWGPDSLTGKFYKEAREQKGELPDDPGAVFTDFVDDFGLTQRRHTIDVMVAQADPGPTNIKTARVSQYKFGMRNDGTDIYNKLQQLQVNPPNLPMFRGGTAPFFGDYIDIAGLMFVPVNGSWAYNTASSKAPVHFATWTDNRDVRPPVGGDWTNYTPVGSGGTSTFDSTKERPSCVANQAGMRNQNVYSSRITQGLLVSSPQNSKPLSTTVQRAFVVLVQNLTNFDKTFRLTIANQPPGGKASFCQYPPCLPPYDDVLDVSIAAHSGIAREVFATSTNPTASIMVNGAELLLGGDPDPDGLTGFVVLNPDGTVPPLINPDAAPGGTDIASVEIYNPNISNPNISNPNISNPNISNPNISNPNISNPNISNPNISNPDIATPNISNPNISNPNISNPNISNPNISNPNISNTPVSDATYVLTNKGNTTASYNVKLIGNAPANAALQLIVTKPYLTPVAKDCQLMQETQNIVLANIINPNISNPDIEIPNISNPNISNPNISNTTLALAPGESVFVTLRGNNVTCCGTPPPPGGATMEEIISTVAPVAVAHAANTDDPTHTPQVAAPLFITTAVLPDGITGQPYSMTLQAIGGKAPYTWSVVQGSLPPGLTQDPATGAISGTPTLAGSYAFTVQATDSASSSASRAFVIRIADPLVVTTPALPAAVYGGAYNVNLAASGGIPPLVWSLVSGSLPSGVVLSSSGLMSGTPTTVGTFSFTVRVHDSSSAPQVADRALSISVGYEGLPPGSHFVFATQPSNATGGEAISPPVVVMAIDGVTHAPLPFVNISMSIGTNPTGGTLSGTLTQTTNGSGSATFADLSIDRGGWGYTLVASSGAVTAVAIFPFNVVGFAPTGTLPVGRASYPATRLPNGKILIAGGIDPSWNVLSTALLYDPATGTFTPTGPMNSPRAAHTATLLTNGKVLVAGGVSEVAACTSGLVGSAELYDPASGTFTLIPGNMVNYRFNYSATPLPDGRVLLAGGGSCAGTQRIVLNTAELYDPQTNMFTATAGPLAGGARETPSATLLPTGKVLIAGGDGGAGALATAELFDPASDTFSLTGSMSVARDIHVAVLLADGRVLVAGGNSGSTLHSSAELYDPFTGAFKPTGSMKVAGTGRRGTLLPNGLVLIEGGGGDTGALSSAELFNPATGSFSLTGSMAFVRLSHTATLLPNGTVLVVGGYHAGGNFALTAEVFYPTDPPFAAPGCLFERTGSMLTSRLNYTATLLPNGKVLVAGGMTSGGAVLASAELYDPFTGVFSPAGNMGTARELHTATLLPNGKVLIAGGFDGTNTLNSAEVYDASGGGSFSSVGVMKAKRINHTATLLPDGTVLIDGGSESSTTAELYDPIAGTFTFTAGSMATKRQDHTATLLPNGMVLLTGTALGSGASAELYDPATKTFSATGSMGSARLDHTATLLPNGKVLVAGGFDGIDSTLNSAEVFDPALGSFTSVGTMGTPRRVHTATLLPNGKVLIAGGVDNSYNVLASAELFDPTTGTFTATGSLGSGRANHAATLLPNGKVLVSGGGGAVVLASAELYRPGP